MKQICQGAFTCDLGSPVTSVSEDEIVVCPQLCISYATIAFGANYPGERGQQIIKLVTRHQLATKVKGNSKNLREPEKSENNGKST